MNDQHFLQALGRFVSEASDSLKFAFEKAFKATRKTKFDNYRFVVRALGSFGQDGATKAELLGKIKETAPNYPATNLNHCLNQLAAEERGGIIRYSASSGTYSFAEPVFRAYVLTSFKQEQPLTGPGAYFSYALPKIPSDANILWTSFTNLDFAIHGSLYGSPLAPSLPDQKRPSQYFRLRLLRFFTKNRRRTASGK